MQCVKKPHEKKIQHTYVQPNHSNLSNALLFSPFRSLLTYLYATKLLLSSTKVAIINGSFKLCDTPAFQMMQKKVHEIANKNCIFKLFDVIVVLSCCLVRAEKIPEILKENFVF